MDQRKIFNDALRVIDDLHLQWRGDMLITCNGDGTIPLNSQVVCEVDLSKLSLEWQGVIRALIVSAPDMARALFEDVHRTGRIGEKGQVAIDKFASTIVDGEKV